MSNLVAVEATNMLNASLAKASYTATTSPVMIRLMVSGTTSTASTAGSELTTGGGYTAGTGQSLTAALGTASGGSITTTSAVVFSNMPACTIVGIEVWDSNATPVRKWFGSITSTVVAAGNTLQFNSGSITLSLS